MKYFFFNHVGSYNHGCEAIIRGTENIIKNCDPDCSFTLSSFNPETDHFDDIKIKKTSYKQLSFIESVIARLNLLIKRDDYYAIKKTNSMNIEQADDSDICISVGGDTYCYGDNRRMQVITEELKRNGKKVVLWGASIGEEDLDEKKIDNLRKLDAIFTRESITYNLLKELDVNKNIFMFPDPAFCMERADVEPIEGFEKKNTIGLNVSPLICRGNEKITDITEKFIFYILKRTEFDILLIPHVMEENNNDYEYMSEFYKKFKSTGRVKILPDNLNAMQYKGYLAKTRFFIGARTHATIGAYSSGVPTGVLGYSVKARGIAKDIFGEEKYVLDSKKINSVDELIDLFNQLQNDEAEIKETLRKKIPYFIKDALSMAEKLKEI